MKGKVYIVQETLRRNESGQLVPAHDLTPARIYGELVTLLPSFKSPLAGAPLIGELQRQLAKFSDDDYLLAVGSPIFIGWAAAIAAQANLGRLKMLAWDRETREYIEVSARLWGRDMKIES